MAISIPAILYGASLSAEYWSAALLHSVYLHNRKVSRATARTSFEGWHGYKPNLKGLRLFRSRVCVKRSGDRHAKLDRHDFTGIFLGFTATDNNVWYIDVNTGIVKTSHHAIFDEAWYLQVSRPPASQLLYNLGLMSEEDLELFEVPDLVNQATYPPCPTTYPELIHAVTPEIQLPLPFRLTAEPPSLAARLTNLTKNNVGHGCRIHMQTRPLRGRIKMQSQWTSISSPNGISFRCISPPMPIMQDLISNLSSKSLLTINSLVQGCVFDLIMSV